MSSTVKLVNAEGVTKTVRIWDVDKHPGFHPEGTTPAKAAKPVDPPVDPAKSVDPAKAGDPAKPVDNAKPGDPAKPAEPAKPDAPKG